MTIFRPIDLCRVSRRMFVVGIFSVIILSGCAPAPVVSPPVATEPPTEITTPTPAPTLEPTSPPMETPTMGDKTKNGSMDEKESLTPQQTDVLSHVDNEGQALGIEALRDLASQLGAPAKDIRIVEAEAVMWSDSSLGCPQPGMMYAQVVTPGYKYVLESAGERFNYHAGNGRVIQCAQ